VRVIGVDGWKRRWIAAVCDGDDLSQVLACDTLAELAAGHPDAAAIVVDVPIGLPVRGRRTADVEARRFVGRRSSSVFAAPPRTVLEAATYREALDLCRSRYGFGISAQAYALRAKVLEAELLDDPRIVEGHPEVTFAALKGAHLEFAKRTWNGQMERRRLLAVAGLDVPDVLEADPGSAPADDVLDAVAMAWTAQRVARGVAGTLPDPPEPIGGRQVAIRF
jgi:predicted RNase H-like nuclease